MSSDSDKQATIDALEGKGRQASKQASNGSATSVVPAVKETVERRSERELKAFSTYLAPEQIKAIKRLALDEERRIHELVGEAIAMLLASRRRD